MSGSFVGTFGGSVVRPANPTYLALDIAENTTLVWPLETTASTPVVAAALDISTAGASLEITMPPANTGSCGVVTMASNVGSHTFTIVDADGGEIVEIDPTESWLIVLTDNEDAAGTWRVLQMASTTSAASAAALAGAGLEASASELRTVWTPVVLNSNTVLTISYRAKLIQWTGPAGILQLDTLANLGSGAPIAIYNGGSGDITLTGTGGEQINGSTSITIQQGESCIVIDGSGQFIAMGILLGTLPIAQGGTGASTAGAALSNLGGTTLGIALFTAPSAASARALLGIVNYTLQEATVSTNQSITEASTNTVFVATAAIAVSLPLTTGLSNQFVVGFYAQSGATTISPQATESINGQAAGSNFVLPAGASALFLTDANGNWWPVFLSFQQAATWVIAGGTGNAITATYSPPVSTLSDGMLLGFRASGPNTSTAPTFAPNGLSALPIYKFGNQPLNPGDIPAISSEVLLRYNASLTGWELLNPVTTEPNWAAAGGTANAITITVAAASGGVYDGLLVGFRASAANTTATPTLNVNGLGAVTITRAGGVALQAGDIPAANAEVIVRYRAAGPAWELVNPYVPLGGLTGTAQSLASPTGFQNTPWGLQMKWGTGSTTSGSGSVSFATAFPTACVHASAVISGGSGTTSLHPLVIGTKSASGFAVWGAATESLSFDWVAWGY